jgi:hypothetical protein
LLHRTGTNEIWQEVSDAVLFTSGSATNWNGRFEVPNILPGYYAFGFKTGVVTTNELNLNSTDFMLLHNRIQTTGNSGMLRIINVSGQVVFEKYIHSQESITTHFLPSGKYIIQMNQQVENWLKP